MEESPGFRGRRLFLAIEIPDYVKERLALLRDDRRKGFHWLPPERLHLTLKFIGEMPGQMQERIEKAVTEAAEGVEPFFLPVEGVGRFPPRGQPHAVWAGLGTGHPRLFQLVKHIEDALFNIGIEPERHVYQPHITLARTSHASPEGVRQFLKEHAAFGTAPFKVEHFVLFESTVREGLRHYIPQRVWPLQDASLAASG